MTAKKKAELLILNGIFFVALLLIGLNVNLFTFKADETPDNIKTPTNLTASDNATKTGISLSWTDNNNSEEGYIIERTGDIFQDYTQIASVSANSTSFIDEGEDFVPNKRYYYRLKAFGSEISKPSQVATPTRVEQLDLLTSTGDFESSSSSSATIQPARGWSFACTKQNSSFQPLEENCFAKVEAGGLNGSNKQTFGLKNIVAADGPQWDYVYQVFPIKGALNYGDKATFSISQVSLQNFWDLPGNINKMAFIRARSSYEGADPLYDAHKVNETVNITQANSSYELEINLPTLPSSVSQDLKENYKIVFEIVLYLSGDLLESQPSISADGAKVLVKDVSQNFNYKTIQIPVTRERKINTQMVLFTPGRHDLIQTAQNFDSIMCNNYDSDETTLLKYYNPNMKLYGYFSVNINDARTSKDTDHQDNFTPIGFAWAAQNHPEWFYQYPENTTVLDPPGDHRSYNVFDPSQGEVYKFRLYQPDGVTPLNYIYSSDYQTRYYAQIDNDPYQQTWREAVVNKLAQTRYDGIFIDDLITFVESGTQTNPISGEKTKVDVLTRQPYEVQDFAHGVIPYLRNNGIKNLEVFVNQSGGHYNGWPSNVLLNPTWSPDNPGQLTNVQQSFLNENKAKFTANNYITTGDIYLQEHAFINLNWDKSDLRNAYSLDYWYKTLIDLDDVITINRDLPAGYKKKVYLLSLNIDRPDIADPAVNPVPQSEISNLNRYDNGWAKFSLTSYLLGASDYSSLGVSKRIPVGIDSNSYSDPIDPGFNLTVKLGDPTGNRLEHIDLYTDKSLQSRDYSNGLVVVNGSPDLTRDFTLSNDYLDELNRTYPKGTTITLKPHSGRIFFLIPVQTPPPTTTTPDQSTDTTQKTTENLQTIPKSTNTQPTNRNIRKTTNTSTYSASPESSDSISDSTNEVRKTENGESTLETVKKTAQGVVRNISVTKTPTAMIIKILIAIGLIVTTLLFFIIKKMKIRKN